MIFINKGLLSLELFGDRLKQYDFVSSGSNNEKYIEFLKKSLKKAIDRDLTERQREIIIGIYFEGKTQAELARIYEINKSTVSRHLKRSIEKLKISLATGI